jgi:DNA-directed RNA polymerase subunit omega
MEKKEGYTNEKILKKFKNQFELVNYAIKQADYLIRSGRAPRVQSEIQNPAVIVVKEIDAGKDKLEDSIIEEKIIETQITTFMHSRMEEPEIEFKEERKRSAIWR